MDVATKRAGAAEDVAAARMAPTEEVVAEAGINGARASDGRRDPTGISDDFAIAAAGRDPGPEALTPEGKAVTKTVGLFAPVGPVWAYTDPTSLPTHPATHSGQSKNIQRRMQASLEVREAPSELS